MGRVLYAILAVVFFGIGAYAWKIHNTGRNFGATADVPASPGAGDGRRVLVTIDGHPITSRDLQWAYDFYTEGMIDGKTMDPAAALGKQYDEDLSPLKTKLLSQLIERKLLYKFVERDEDFDLNNPARYESCLQEWHAAVGQASDITKKNPAGRRLKSRLCERSILDQYLEEVLFRDLEVTDSEVVSYYRENRGQFKKPERVVIRQIVLAEEREAKRVWAKTDDRDFAALAREKSITPEAKNGGKLGPFARGEMPRVFDVAFDMRRGQVSHILKSTYGFHLIKLIKKLEPEELSLAEARPEIREILKEKERRRRYRDWVDKALGAIPVNAGAVGPVEKG